MREETLAVIGFVLKEVLGVQKCIGRTVIIPPASVDLAKVLLLISEQGDLNEDVELEITGNKQAVHQSGAKTVLIDDLAKAKGKKQEDPEAGELQLQDS
ncbi:hypothetical protein P7K49_036040 [Saguinus oedipus]|uniref:Uncharacterized protein n=1 Tax=Saguinus oedipus TaxID=9490 RepID=A0ABQ9TPB0_SAGOE|nr:hypothetical protein P7K49_036040 [Saguinus oedipus]